MYINRNLGNTSYHTYGMRYYRTLHCISSKAILSPLLQWVQSPPPLHTTLGHINSQLGKYGPSFLPFPHRGCHSLTTLLLPNPLMYLVLSNLAKYQSWSISCFIVSILIRFPNSTFLYMYFAWSSVRYLVSLSFVGFDCPLMFAFKCKNVAGPFLPSISLNVLILFLLMNPLD